MIPLEVARIKFSRWFLVDLNLAKGWESTMELWEPILKEKCNMDEEIEKLYLWDSALPEGKRRKRILQFLGNCLVRKRAPKPEMATSAVETPIKDDRALRRLIPQGAMPIELGSGNSSEVRKLWKAGAALGYRTQERGDGVIIECLFAIYADGRVELIGREELVRIRAAESLAAKWTRETR